MKMAFNRFTIINIAITGIFLMVSTGFSIKTNQEKKSERKIQIALLLDTSNSMDGLIEQAKSQLWNIVNELAKAKCQDGDPTLEIALYEYGNSRLTRESDYVRQVLPLISDLDKISVNLFALTTSGGEEYCGSVISKATKNLEWSSSDKDIKMIFIAGNEPFTQGKISYESACGNARAKGIIINTIHCGDYNEGVQGLWKSGAMIGGGDFMSIDQNRRTVYVATPYDDRINELSIMLNNTYIYYGTSGLQKKMEQEQADEQAASYSKANLSTRNSVKASKFYKNTTWDLVDATDEENFDITEVDKKTLPKEFQSMTNAELQAYVEKKKAERESIKNQINVLNNARSLYIAKNKTTQNESVESSMIKAVKKQAILKNFTW